MPLLERSDEVLCALAAAGDHEAEECLVARHNRLVRICARPYFLAGGDSEDLIQEGMIGLLSAIRGFDPQREAVFRTYAETCIQNRLRTAVRDASRGKHAPLNRSVSLDTPLFDNTCEFYAYGLDRPAENPEDTLIGREEREGRMEALRGKLSVFEKAVLDLYLAGLSYAEIAARLGKPLKAVDNGVQRIRRKAAPFFSGDSSES